MAAAATKAVVMVVVTAAIKAVVIKLVFPILP